MTTTTASQFKAKLGRYMKAARNGREVVITDRGEPVAKLVPFSRALRSDAGVVISKPRDPTAPPLGEVRVRGIKGYRGPNTTELLAEDRGDR